MNLEDVANIICIEDLCLGLTSVRLSFPPRILIVINYKKLYIMVFISYYVFTRQLNKNIILNKTYKNLNTGRRRSFYN